MTRRHWRLLVVATLAVAAVLVFDRHYYAHHRTPAVVATYPPYTPARCATDIGTNHWEWLDERAAAGGWTPILCGAPQGSEPRPAQSPYAPKDLHLIEQGSTNP